MEIYFWCMLELEDETGGFIGVWNLSDKIIFAFSLE